MPWNWDCKLWANWNASSHPAECCDLPSARIRLVEMEGPGEAARSGRSAAKGRSCHHLKSVNDRLWVGRAAISR